MASKARSAGGSESECRFAERKELKTRLELTNVPPLYYQDNGPSQAKNTAPQVRQFLQGAVADACRSFGAIVDDPDSAATGAAPRVSGRRARF